MHAFDAGGGRLSSVLGKLAELDPDRPALVFLDDGESEAGRMTRRQMHERAMQIAAAMRDRGLVGERVLLAFHSSLDYVVAFLACVYAGVIAVPVYPPRQTWHSRRLVAIARDAGAGLVLTSDNLCTEVSERLNAADGVNLDTLGLGALQIDGAGWINEQVQPQELAYLQYTSGSTGDPKGVMITHTNLAMNAAFIARSAGLEGGTAFVSWLPIYHDMGLVAGIVLPLMLGATAVFMPPAAFVQQPLNWLKAIDKYRGEFSAAPNFAFDLCVARVTPEQAAALDLSSWRVALNGAEPIWATTIDAFNERFSAGRASPALTSGGYGMAEATLVVTIGALDEVSPRLVVDKTALAADRIVLSDEQAQNTTTFVSSGHVRSGYNVCIVRPQDSTPCEPLEVGEIWASGPCVGQGYWQREEATAETFRARVLGRTGVNWLRTGDLGFVHEGQLYVTGRLKDLIIVRGANHYPQDLERTAEQAHPSLRQGGYSAAFTIDSEHDAPQVVIVQEVERSARKSIDVSVVGRAIADAVAREHGIEVDMVVLVPPATVPKTSSGKIQRRACRISLLAKEWAEIGRWERPVVQPMPVQMPQQWMQWLRERVAALVGRSVDDVTSERPFSEMGLDSVKVVQLVADLSQAIGRKLPTSLLYDHPTIARLAALLSGGQSPQLAASNDRAVPIAIVGMGCRVPGADGLEAFWRLLDNGDVAIREVPEDRARLTGWNPPADAPHRFVGLLDDVDAFDAAAFGIAPREAQSMDPQQRLLLETAWHALEHAHIAPDRLGGSATGVFVGVSSNDYYRLQRSQSAGTDGHAGTGGALSIAANRISYVLGLQGPSLAIDTACSSSLVAVHQACRSLAAGECGLALAGGVNLVLCEDLGTIFGQAGMLAADGRCKTFDDSADGYVRGEGCGVLVLKRLDDALRDGDPVRAVIAGSAVNQDGASNGLTAPNGLAQQRVVHAALQRAGLEGQAIDYVETHGTGTSLGDPVEVHALRAVLGEANSAAAPCWLGALKTQIGHLEAAAGVMGVIKATLALQRQKIPANRNFTRLNSKIELGARLRPATEPVAWTAQAGRQRHAGVSSFGFGGTNSHIVLQEAPTAAATETAPRAALLHMVSARSEDALKTLARQHAAALAEAEPAHAPSLAHVSQTGRAHLEERVAVVAQHGGDLAKGLQSIADGMAPPELVTLIRRRVRADLRPAFLFTGQGAQYAGMGESLYRDEPAFRRTIERCDAALAGELGVPLTELMFGSETGRLEDTRYGQPALVALQLGLSALWAERGVRPSWVCGHSVGEYAAAVACGLMDVETALKLVVLRARLMSEAPGQGGMLSVAADEQQAFRALGPMADTLEVAGCNSPRQTVLSGDVAAITLAVARLVAMGLPAKRLAVSHAFHSRLMDPVLESFEPAVVASRFGDVTLPFVATGAAVDADVRQPRYWVEQIRQPVRFVQAIQHLQTLGAKAFIEIGPGATLTSLVRDTLDGDVERIASLQRGVDATLAWHAAAGAWWAAGGTLEPANKPARSRLGPVELPGYPFERRRHWFTPGAVGATRPATTHRAIVGERIDLADDSLRVFDARLPEGGAPWLRDHVVAGRPVMPGAGWISLALQAMADVGSSATLSQLSFDQPLDLDGTARVQTRLSRRDGSWELRISKQLPDATWVDCARGHWQSGAGSTVERRPSASAAQEIPADTLYADLAACGLAYGPAFRLLSAVHKGQDHVEATVRPAVASVGEPRTPHPAWLDAVFQSVGALLVADGKDGSRAPVPVAIDALHWHGRAVEADAQVMARLRTRDEAGAVVDISVWDEQGQALLQVDGLQLRWVTGLGDRRDNVSYVAEWQALQVSSIDSRHWLVVAEDDSAARQLATELTEAGGKATAFEGGWQRVPSLIDALRSAWRQQPQTGLLVVASKGAGTDDVEPALQRCEGLQSLLLACDPLAVECSGLTVGLVTEDALAGPGCSAASIVGAAAAAIWRSAAHELPALTLRHADLSAHRTSADAHVLAQALSSDETEVRIHAGAAHVRRLQPAAAAATPTPLMLADGAVLVTGGTGALGLHVAGWLVDAGARHVVLVSRRAEVAPADAARVQRWRASGCRIELLACDIADRGQAMRLVDGVVAQGVQLRGIVHAAGTNDDAPLALLDGARWRGTAEAKVLGAKWLDECTRQLPLDFFIAFSSAASPLGSPGQCNYAAANAMLEAVLQRRTAAQASATRAVSLQWGPWAGAGMADSEAVRQALARRGLSPLDVAPALDALRQALGGSERERLVARIDWSGLAASSHGAIPSAWRAMATRSEIDTAAESQRPSADELLALDKPDALAAIRVELAAQLAQVLKLDAGQLPVQDPPRFDRLRLSSLGLDSLMAMEMRNRMRAWLGVDLPAHVLIGGVEIGEVLDLIHEKALLRSLSQPAVAASDADSSADDDMEVMVL